MDAYSVHLTTTARKDLSRLQDPLLLRIVTALRALAQVPLPARWRGFRSEMSTGLGLATTGSYTRSTTGRSSLSCTESAIDGKSIAIFRIH